MMDLALKLFQTDIFWPYNDVSCTSNAFSVQKMCCVAISFHVYIKCLKDDEACTILEK